MQTKLTLRLEKDLIEGAKEWAEKNDISLSQPSLCSFID